MDIYKDHSFQPTYFPPELVQEDAWVLAFIDNKLALRKFEENFSLITVIELRTIIPDIDSNELKYIGNYEGHDCYGVNINRTFELPEHYELTGVREITKLTGDTGLFHLAGTANHILNWHNVNKYCGRCGHEMKDKGDERARICPDCGYIVYPRISPATITAVLRDDQILLAHNTKFREGMFSLIAGFVEVGETLEQCVEREIMEEVGLKVKNVQYIGSQPWPFPDSMMLAFTAEYESGEITVDNVEIAKADWFRADCLPDIPSADSIAGKIIRWYRDQYFKT